MPHANGPLSLTAKRAKKKGLKKDVNMSKPTPSPKLLI